MKRLLIALLLIAVPAFGQPVSEWETQKAGYSHIGTGINYEAAPGTFVPATDIITDGATTWGVTDTHTPWVIDKTTRTITFTRGDKEIELTPKGVYYVDKATWDVAKVGDLTNPSITTPDSKTVRLDGIFPNVNMVVHSRVQGPRIAYEFTTQAGYPSASSLGMTAASTWVGVVHEITGLNQPVIEADEAAPDWGGTDASVLTFKATKDWQIAPSDAVDANGKTTPIRNFLVDKGGKKYFVETIKYAQFLAATFPVEFQGYSAIGGAIAIDTTLSGEYFVTPYITLGNQVDITIDPSTIFKVDPAQFTMFYNTSLSATITANGPTDFGSTMIQVTSCDDDTIGTPMAAEEAECDGTPAVGDCGSFVYNSNSPLISLTGVYVVYHGATYGALYHQGAFQDNDLVLLDSNIVMDSRVEAENDDSSLRAVDIATCQTSSTGNTFTMENNITHVSGIHYRLAATCGASGTMTLKNNLCKTFSSATAACIEVTKSVGSTVNISHMTMIGDGAGSGADYGIEAKGIYALDSVTDNYAEGLDFCYETATEATVHTNNRGFNCASSAFDANWNAGGTETTTDGDMVVPTGHTPATSIPTWLQAYHANTGSPNVNGGSQLASTAGLDSMHIRSDGGLDDATVDVGFHYYGGGAPAPSAPTFQNYLYSPFGKGQLWDRERL